MSTKIEVKKENVYELFKKKLLVPEYQREYVWNNDNVEKLINDIKNYYINKDNENKEYFLGSLLLYKKNNGIEEYEIIDGQQRVITLYLILNNNTKIQNKYSLEIYSSILNKSKHNILSNNNYIQKIINKDIILYKFIEKVVFTVITTNNIDDAFTFFDTHNTSGVRLDTVDLLKAYHLRSLRNISSESVENIVSQWDNNNAQNGMKKILEDINFSIRTTKGKKLLYGSRNTSFEYKKIILNNYKNQDMNENLAYKELFINKIIFDDNENYNLEINNKQNSTDNIPFSIRQPIADGLSFFLYSNKYKKLYDYLFKRQDESKQDNNIVNLNKIYFNIIKKLNIYLVLTFEHLVFYYYDRFENEELYSFTIKVLEIIGYYRLKHHSVRETVYRNIILDNDIINLFDLINMAYNTKEIIDTLSIIIDSLLLKEKLSFKKLNNARQKFYDNIKNPNYNLKLKILKVQA